MVIALYSVPIATAMSHWPIRRKVVRMLTIMQIILQTIDLTTDRFTVSCMIFIIEFKKLKAFLSNPSQNLKKIRDDRSIKAKRLHMKN